MLALRGLWVLHGEPPRIAFSRRFPTVEGAYKRSAANRYLALPYDVEFSEALLAAIRADARPIAGLQAAVALSLRSGNVWPVVYAAANGFIVAAVPAVSGAELESDRGDLAAQPSITASVVLTEDVAEACGAGASEAELLELQAALTAALPFGRPLDSHPLRLRLNVRAAFGPPDTAPHALRRPQWRPHAVRGKARLELSVQEELHAAFHEDGAPPALHLTGQLVCRAELDGLPEVSFALTQPTRLADLGPLLFDASAAPPARQQGAKVTLSPPAGSALVASYSIRDLREVPLSGAYQMRASSPRNLRFTLLIRLAPSLPPTFDHFDATLPFFGRGNIVQSELTASAGAATIEKRRAVVWRLGPKVTGRNGEVVLQGALTFDGAAHDPPLAPGEDDPFCHDANCYARIAFRCAGHTFSGADVDAKSVSVYPGTRPPLTIERTALARHVLIWNSLGDARVAAAPSPAPAPAP